MVRYTPGDNGGGVCEIGTSGVIDSHMSLHGRYCWKGDRIESPLPALTIAQPLYSIYCISFRRSILLYMAFIDINM